MRKNENVRLATVPWRGIDSLNSYVQSFYGALQSEGIQIDDSLVYQNDWLHQHQSTVDGIHLQWAENFWPRRGEAGTTRRLRSVFGLKRFLRIAKRLGLLRLGTLHNTQPHEGSDWVDHIGMRQFVRELDIVICHSQSSVDEAVARFGVAQERCVTVSHGNYAGQFPAPSPCSRIRAKFGLPSDSRIYTCLGCVREYKGFDIAIDAFIKRPGLGHLVVAGRPEPLSLKDSLLRQIQNAPHIHLIARELTPQEYIDLLSISEATLLPYRNITGSGALLAAWTAGTFTVASDLSFFREMLTRFPHCGRILDSLDSVSLARSIESTSGVDLTKRRDEIADTTEKHLSWQLCVAPLAEKLKHTCLSDS